MLHLRLRSVRFALFPKLLCATTYGIKVSIFPTTLRVYNALDSPYLFV